MPRPPRPDCCSFYAVPARASGDEDSSLAVDQPVAVPLNDNAHGEGSARPKWAKNMQMLTTKFLLHRSAAAQPHRTTVGASRGRDRIDVRTRALMAFAGAVWQARFW